MLRVLLAGAGFLVDWHQPHETHQTTHTMPTAFIVITFHIPGHLTRSLPRRLQELFVGYFHESQVLGTLTLWLVVQI